MKYLNFLDNSIIALYFIILIAIGQILKKRASASLNDYFLGGRKMPWWLLGISSMAAWVDMTGTMIITSFLFLLGPRGLYIEFRGGACLVLIFLLLWLGKWHRRSGCMTLAEWMIFRFGDDFRGNVAKLVALVSTIILYLSILAYSFVGAGLFLSMFFPYPPWVCCLGLLIITIIYTIEAGFYGVVISDLFQMVIFVVAAVFITIMAVSKASAANGIEAIAISVTGNKDWMSSLPSLHTTMPPGYQMYQGLLAVGGFYLAKTIIQGLGQGFDPKYFGARNDRECGLLSFMCGWTMAIRWFLMMGFVVLGLFLIKDFFADQSKLTEAAALIKQQVGSVPQHKWAELLSNIMNHPERYSQSLIDGLKNLLGPDWAQRLSLLSYHGTVDYERILPAVLLSLPVGFRGLMLVALLAAAMSTFNAFINMATAFLTNDVYKSYIRPKASNRELIYISYGFGIVVVTISFLTAYSSKSINDIWGWITMGLAGGLIIPLTLRLYWWRFNGMGFAIGTSCGVVAALLQRAFLPDMIEWKQFVFITLIGLVSSIIGTYLDTTPTDRKVLENFYIKTRPFGFWKPFEHLLGKEGLKLTRREHFYDIISVPFTFLWQVTILLIPMQLVIGAYRSCIITSCIFLISLAGMYFFWYKKLPAANYDSITTAIQSESK